MEIFKYIPLNSITKTSDRLLNKDRRKEVYIDGEKWEYCYYSGELHNVIKKEITSVNKDWSKGVDVRAISYYFKNKKINKCFEREYSYEPHPGRGHFYNGIKHLYFIDEYMNNIGDLELSYWEDGKAHGIWREWDDHGQKNLETNHVNGLPDGEWISYWNNNIIACKGKYKMGKHIGRWTYYNKDGSLKNIEIYDNDKLIETTEY